MNWRQREAIRYLVTGKPFPEAFSYMYKVLAEDYGVQTEGRQ